jgi:uncharacterized membrane protein YesL
MHEVAKIIRAGLGDIWYDVFTVAVVNLIWLVSQVLIIPGPPATLALFFYGNRLAHEETADLKDFLRAWRNSWSTGWRWGALNLFLIVILIGDIALTGRLGQATGFRLIQGFYLAALLVWSLVQLYALPMLFEQKEPSLRLALRNGAAMLANNPVFSLSLAVLLFLTLLLGTLAFLLSLAVGGVFLAAVANRAVLNRLKHEGLRTSAT